jgi:hypothetical protein
MDKKQRADLGESLVESIGNSEISDITTEAWDLAIDTFLEDGVLKDIPVIGWAVKALKARQSVRDALFLKKIVMFLIAASEISAEEKENFTIKINQDKNYRQKVGENLLLLIDRHERIEKSLLLGRLFAAHIKNELSHEQFMRLSTALDRSVIEDLEVLNKRRANYFMVPKITREGLYRSGLMDMRIEVPEMDPRLAGKGLNTKGKYDYEMNDLGKAFIKYAFEPLESE